MMTILRPHGDNSRHKMKGRFFEPFLAQQGFTLIELLAVTAIIGVLATMAIPTFNQMTMVAKRQRCIAELRTFERDIKAFSLDRGDALPTSLNDVHQGTVRDPWGNFYVYVNLSIGGTDPFDGGFGGDLNTDFDLYSVGPDGQSAADLGELISKDDVVRAGNGSWYGVGDDF